MNSGWYTLLGAAIASIVALLTAWLNNKEQTKRLAKQLTHEESRQMNQLDHDSRQREIEREKSLQREIYLGAIEAMTAWQEYLGKFADVDLEPGKHGQVLEGANAKFAKAYVIASLDMVNALNKINAFFSKNALILATKRIELNSTNQEIEYINFTIQTILEKGNQVISHLEMAAKTNPTNNQLFLQSVAEHQSKIEGLTAQRDDLIKRRHSIIIDLSKEALRVANEFAVVSVPPTVIARQELGFITDDKYKNDFKREIESVATDISDHAIKWINSFEEKIASS